MSQEAYEPIEMRMVVTPPPRISGTAMPHGVFLSTGTTSTGSAFSLALTGFTIVTLGITSLAPTYIVAWTLDQLLRPLNLSLTAVLLQVGGPADASLWALARVICNVIAFFAFLLLLRQTPLAGHHAAEHMTVHAIEKFGIYGWEPFVITMPRAHLRCGSNLLAGVLPAMLIGMPLLPVLPVASVLIAIAGWAARHRMGFFLQNHFTTRQPSPRELRRGIRSGEKLLEQWMNDPKPRLSMAHKLWLRGLPQLMLGVVCASYLLDAIAARAHIWLDW